MRLYRKLWFVVLFYFFGSTALEGQEIPKEIVDNLPIRIAPKAEGEGECDPTDPANQDKLKLIGPEFNIGPGTLKGAPIPQPSNLGEFVKNKEMAIVLGKALFWDMQVGSDGIQACATCHFRAGADPRSVNQLAPGGKGQDSFFDIHFQAKTISDSKETLRSVRTFDLKPPNSSLAADDFPLHKLEDPTNRKSRVISDVDDVVSSQGVIRHQFMGVTPGSPSDSGGNLDDSTFQVNGRNIRRVEPRNTPTVINAIFNHRNFWDGRAQEIFNGRNIAGVRDENAKVIKALNARHLVATKVRIDNASLASLSVGPPLSADEMSFEGRTFPEIGKRILKCEPLRAQVVADDDSVLGVYSRSFRSGRSNSAGLVHNYEYFVKEAFHEAWWRSDLVVDVDINGNETFVEPIVQGSPDHKRYRLAEYNFSLFYGLALQCYMATLVSDDAKIDQHFDRKQAGLPDLLTEEELRGMGVFTSEKARCADCHHGPEFSGPNVRALKTGFWAPGHPKIKPPFSYWQPPEEVERMFIGSCDVALYNQGFYNIGVRPFVEDLGIGGLDLYGNPLSAAELLANKSMIRNRELRDLFVPRLSLTYFPSLASTVDEFLRVPEIAEGERTAVMGAFKMPSLRNVELTAPYFHTGGYLTLRQVVEFYNRGGDFHDWVSSEGIPQDRFMDLGIGKLELSEQEINDLVAFLKTLTDQRVVSRAAPFDHPQLFVPNGHKISEIDGQTIVEDIIVEIPVVGRFGGAPIDGFLEF
ncbi:MAG: cytochrome C peroxidase [Armatimonadota bacterium]